MLDDDKSERCPDTGTCHHECANRCFRVQSCAPLSIAKFPDDWWPDDILVEHKICSDCHAPATAAENHVVTYQCGSTNGINVDGVQTPACEYAQSLLERAERQTDLVHDHRLIARAIFDPGQIVTRMGAGFKGFEADDLESLTDWCARAVTSALAEAFKGAHAKA